MKIQWKFCQGIKGGMMFLGLIPLKYDPRYENFLQDDTVKLC